MARNRKADRRVRRTRKLLQSALIQLLREKPLSKIQIKEIVEVADVSRPTFYLHFDTKEALLFSHIDDLFDKIHDELFADVGEGKTVDTLALMTASYQQWQRHNEALQWVLQVENKDLLIAHLHKHFSALKVEFDKHVPPLNVTPAQEEYVLGFITGGGYMLLKTWLNNGMRESAEEMAQLTALLLLNGFSPVQALHLQRQAVLGSVVD